LQQQAKGCTFALFFERWFIELYKALWGRFCLSKAQTRRQTATARQSIGNHRQTIGKQAIQVLV